MNMQFFHQVFFITLITSDRKVFEKNVYLDIKSVIIVCFQIKKKKKTEKNIRGCHQIENYPNHK